MMAHWAEIDNEGNVIRILVVDEDKDENWLNAIFGGQWMETSYSESFRKHYAGSQDGMTYDSELDAFIPPKPFDSWVLDEETAQWEAPVEYPSDGKNYIWDDDELNWTELAD